MRLNPLSTGFILLLGALSALPPLGVDLNLPAIPQMAHELGQPASSAALSLSVFLLGFAVAPPLLAPLSDYFGRRPVLLGGLALFALCGVVCAVAPSLHWVLAGRLFQGMGAGIGTAMPLAIIRDSFEGPVARSRISYMVTVLNVAPLLAPSLGALVLPIGGWRGIFVVLALGGLFLVTAVGLGLDESLKEKYRPASHPKRLPAAYLQVLRHRPIMGFSLVNALCFACLFGFVSASPLVVMGHLGLGPQGFGLVFGCAACGLIAGSLINGRLARRPGLRHDRVLLAALSVNVLSTAGLFLLAFTHHDRLGIILPLIVTSQLCFGVASPNAVHEAMQPMPERAGVVSAILRSIQMLAGAASSAIIAGIIGLGVGSAVAMTGMMATATACALIVFLLTPHGPTPHGV